MGAYEFCHNVWFFLCLLFVVFSTRPRGAESINGLTGWFGQSQGRMTKCALSRRCVLYPLVITMSSTNATRAITGTGSLPSWNGCLRPSCLFGCASRKETDAHTAFVRWTPRRIATGNAASLPPEIRRKFGGHKIPSLAKGSGFHAQMRRSRSDCASNPARHFV